MSSSAVKAEASAASEHTRRASPGLRAERALDLIDSTIGIPESVFKLTDVVRPIVSAHDDLYEALRRIVEHEGREGRPAKTRMQDMADIARAALSKVGA